MQLSVPTVEPGGYSTSQSGANRMRARVRWNGDFSGVKQIDDGPVDSL